MSVIPTFFAERENHASVTFKCPICGRKNRHGMPIWTRDCVGHRVSHCRCYDNGYNIDIIEPVIVKTTKQYNEEYRRCKAKKIPFFPIKQKRGTFEIHCDMWPINYDLSPEAVNKCTDVLRKAVKRVKGKNAGFWISKTGFTISKVPAGYHVGYISKLSKIVYDPANYVSIFPEEQTK